MSKRTIYLLFLNLYFPFPSFLMLPTVHLIIMTFKVKGLPKKQAVKFRVNIS